MRTLDTNVVVRLLIGDDLILPAMVCRSPMWCSPRWAGSCGVMGWIARVARPCWSGWCAPEGWWWTTSKR
jgi:hypothetical protein